MCHINSLVRIGCATSDFKRQIILPLDAYGTIKRYGEKVISNGLVITKLVPASLVNLDASWYRCSSIALCENLEGQEQPNITNAVVRRS
jgi:hypothetical protein